MSINTEEFRAAPIDSRAQYQSDHGFAGDRQRSSEVSAAPSVATVTDLVGDVSLAMRQFYQSPARSLG